jgi:hypothetical protein
VISGSAAVAECLHTEDNDDFVNFVPSNINGFVPFDMLQTSTTCTEGRIPDHIEWMIRFRTKLHHEMVNDNILVHQEGDLTFYPSEEGNPGYFGLNENFYVQCMFQFKVMDYRTGKKSPTTIQLMFVRQKPSARGPTVKYIDRQYFEQVVLSSHDINICRCSYDIET